VSKILMTGATGSIGRTLAAMSEFELAKLLGRKNLYALPNFIECDHTDVGDYRNILKDVDVVIHLAPYKASLELWYVEQRSLKLNVILMFLTIYVVLLPNSAAGTRSPKNIPQMLTTLRDKMEEMSQ